MMRSLTKPPCLSQSDMCNKQLWTGHQPHSSSRMRPCVMVSRFFSFCLFCSPSSETDAFYGRSGRRDGTQISVRYSKTASVTLSVRGTKPQMSHQLEIKWSKKATGMVNPLLLYRQGFHILFFLSDSCHHLVWNINSNQRTKFIEGEGAKPQGGAPAKYEIRDI